MAQRWSICVCEGKREKELGGGDQGSGEAQLFPPWGSSTPIGRRREVCFLTSEVKKKGVGGVSEGARKNLKLLLIEQWIDTFCFLGTTY